MGQRNGEQRRRQVLSISDPLPVAAVSGLWRTAAQAATIGIFVILAIAALYFARPVLLPVASAFVITMMLSPLSKLGERYRIPNSLSALLLWLLVLAVFYGVIIMLSAPVVDWIGKAPDIGRIIQEKLRVLQQPLSALQDLRTALLPADAKDKVGVDIVSLVQPALSLVTPAIGQLLIFFGVLFFMLLGRSRLRRVFVVFFDDRDARLRSLRIMKDIERDLSGYLSVVGAINIGMGIAAGLIAWLVGLPNPAAWAVLGFLLNFISYIGALIMEAAFFLVGLVTFPTLTYALAAPLLYVVVATLEGHFITPSVIGRQLTLNPLIVFLSLVFWTWLWGPVGTFLSAPFLVMTLVVIHHLFPDDDPDLPD